jgi:branched-chain amino acid transport system permease protein
MIEVSGSVLVSGLINGICLAGIYILIALGLTLILSIMNILQFAHGEIYMIGAFVVYYLTVDAGLNIFLAMFISMLVTGVLGLILERLIFRRFLGKFMPVVCAAIGLMLILQTSVVLGFGLDVKAIPSPWPGTLNIMAWNVPYDRLTAVLASIALTSILFLFLKLSKFGQAIVATAQHREGAILQGINPNLMYAVVMVIGSALAAVAGGFAGAIFILDPYMGGLALMKGITIIVLGGMGSLLGVIVGGIILGLSDSIISVAFGPAAAAIAPLILVILILIIRPQGIFGHA